MQYIGQHKGAFTTVYIGSGTRLRRAVKKYGKSEFSVEPIYFAFTHDDLQWAEEVLIEEYNARQSKQFYNIGVGGRCGAAAWNKGIPNPKQSERMKLNNPNKDGLYGTNSKGKTAWNKGCTPDVDKICEQCSKEFKVKYKYRSARFCNKACAASYSNVKRTGFKNRD